MTDQGLWETTDLEAWLVEYPELVDPTLKVVTTQFDTWRSGTGSASERLDILAIATSGELVVIELKRGSDRNIHLQAITYGALVSGFTENTLAAAHAAWLNKSAPGSADEQSALESLQAHVEDWSEAILALPPRLVLVAEQFSPQVLTTVEWLHEVAEGLQIECHQYNVFRDGDTLAVAFDRVYPVVDISEQILRPGQRADRQRLAERSERQRRAKSVAIIHEFDAIPTGARIDLELQGQARPEVADVVNAWLDAEPSRRDVTWVADGSAPLRWAAAADPTQQWTLSALRNEIFAQAGVAPHRFSAADAWAYAGRRMHVIATESLGQASEPD